MQYIRKFVTQNVALHKRRIIMEGAREKIVNHGSDENTSFEGDEGCQPKSAQINPALLAHLAVSGRRIGHCSLHLNASMLVELPSPSNAFSDQRCFLLLAQQQDGVSANWPSAQTVPSFDEFIVAKYYTLLRKERNGNYRLHSYCSVDLFTSRADPEGGKAEIPPKPSST